MKLIKAALFIEVLVGLGWTFSVASIGSEGLGVLVVFVVTAPIALVLMGVGAWKAIKEPETRPVAAWVILLPLAFLFLPSVLTGVMGSSAFQGGNGQKAWLVLGGAPVAFAVVRPRSVGAYLPRFVVESRPFNVAVVGGLVLIIGAMLLVVFAFVNQESIGSEFAPVFALLGPLILGGAVFAIFVAFTAYLGFFQPAGKEQNWLRVVQLVLALPIPIATAAGFVFLAALAIG